jgi:hypothetical protein
MGKHRFKVTLSFGANKMKSRTKDTNVEIQPGMLDHIHFSTCMYITMWAAKKEEHAHMIKAKLENFRQPT